MSYLDEAPLDYGNADVQLLNDLLSNAYSTPIEARMLAARAGLPANLMPQTGTTMQQIWFDYMAAMANAGLLRKMVEVASADRAKAAYSAKFRALLGYVITQPKPDQPVTKNLEDLIFGQQRDARLPFAFVERAKLTARSVARLKVPRIFDGVKDGFFSYGTGWIIAPGVLITNYHVINAREKYEPAPKKEDFEAQAQQAEARFDFYDDPPDRVYLECKSAKLIAANPNLDYALIEVAEAKKIARRKPLRLVAVQPTLARGTRMNIVQYPNKGPLRFAIRNNFYVSPSDEPSLIWYQTDTEAGASGSPVCNDDWQVVALHHAAQDVAPRKVDTDSLDGQPVEVKVLNEAIKMRDILNDLPAEVKERIEKAQQKR